MSNACITPSSSNTYKDGGTTQVDAGLQGPVSSNFTTNPTTGYIIVQQIHKAPWIAECATERLNRIEVLAGTIDGYGPCIFWSERSALEALEKLRKAVTKSSHSSFREHLTAMATFDQLYMVRKIYW